MAPEMVPVECSGPECTDTKQMGERWEDARRFCSEECKYAFHEERAYRSELIRQWVRDARPLLEKMAKGQVFIKDQDEARALLEREVIPDA